MIIIGSARISENGTIDGKRGDQTGAEVATEEYYKHRYGWNVLRCKDPNKAVMMSYDMASACANDNFGYSQSDRYSGLYESKVVGYDTAKVATRCNVDCSSLVRVCLAYAGYEVGDFYTGNEYDVIMETGAFEDVTGSIDQDTGEGLYSGDILVSKQKGHTAIVTEGIDPRPQPAPPTPEPPKPHIEPYPVNEGELAIYRLYNPNSGEHILVNNTTEGDNLIDVGWQYEGIAFIEKVLSDIPVIRLRAENAHIYTTDIKEMAGLWSAGWLPEQITFYADGDVPVYRVYCPSNGDHLFTVKADEKDNLIANGWMDEGVRFNCLRAE